tara:strand:- start:4169 stop:4756 length:588 start_codon:yes stop_codon:yes gene_type:complete
MNKHIEFLKDNIRFSLAIFANAVALLASIWWIIDSNWKSANPLEIEPIVTCLALSATLLGLNFVNDKLTKPYLKVSLSMAMTQHHVNGLMYGISITLENHSMIKAFIKNFQVQLPETNQVLQFLYDGFTDTVLPKVVIEPGQSYSFNIIKKNLGGTSQDIKSYGDFVVTTDIGHKFTVPAKVFREHVATLLACKT